MSVHEYSKMAGIGTETVHKLIKEGVLTATKIGDGTKCSHMRILVKEDERIVALDQKVTQVLEMLESSKIMQL
jgi:hypothetical protein